MIIFFKFTGVNLAALAQRKKFERKIRGLEHSLPNVSKGKRKFRRKQIYKYQQQILKLIQAL